TNVFLPVRTHGAVLVHVAPGRVIDQAAPVVGALQVVAPVEDVVDADAAGRGGVLLTFPDHPGARLAEVEGAVQPEDVADEVGAMVVLVADLAEFQRADVLDALAHVRVEQGGGQSDDPGHFPSSAVSGGVARLPPPRLRAAPGAIDPRANSAEAARGLH